MSTNDTDSSTRDRREHDLRPLLLDAAAAHAQRWLRYREDGTALLRHPAHARHGLPPEIEIAPDHQFPAVRATFDDLNKPLSRLANSPRVEGELSLRQLYERELAAYEALAAAAYAEGRFEPDYGSYVFDRSTSNLYLIAPERWHRLALVTSNSKLVTDPKGELSWGEIRERLENTVIGFAGASVGSNLLEGWLREARPRCVKIADPDWVELTNFNRIERLSLRHLVGSRARRFDAKNPYESSRVSKAACVAYEQQLVDPYLQAYVYTEGLTRANIDRFFRGDGGAEPAIDILVEEMDDLDLKIVARQIARQHRTDVLMVSDFGNTAHVLWNPFASDPGAALGYGASDQDVLQILERIKTGDRSKLLEFVTALCGEGFMVGSFGRFFRGEGEQPTSSLPQSGATAMASGAIGGKELALRVLGHPRPQGNRVIYDLENRRSAQG